MEKIESFKIDHERLEKGLYVSRIDNFDGVDITTFDLRITAPNKEPVIDMPALHTIEHLGATYLRNSEFKDDIVYFGPMGCRTGCYLLMKGRLNSSQVLPLILEFCDFVINFKGDIPGAKKIECGNYLEQNLTMAKYYIEKYKNSLLKEKNFTYAYID